MKSSAKLSPAALPLCVIMVACLLAANPVFAQRGISINTDQPSDRRVALVIGNAKYQSSPLRNPVNDARLMAATLKALGFEVIEGEDADLLQMKRLLKRFGGELDRGGVGLFYYAGHGVQIDGINYLIPIGADIDSEFDVELEGLDMRRVLVEMREARNRLNLVFLDACRDNPYSRSFRSASNGLAKMDAPYGTLIAFATGEGKVAADGDGKNGLFTEELAKNITSPGLTVEEVLKRTRRSVAQRTSRKQIPWSSSSLTGNFYFKPVEGRQPFQLAGDPGRNRAPGGVRPRTEPAPASRPETAKPKPAGTADLYVTTEPGQAMVYLDGVQKGRSPQTLEMIPVGRHVITVRKGYLVGREEITLVRDDLKKVHIELMHQKGDVKLFSDPPGAEVRLDGKLVCKATPCKVSGVKAGVYRLEVTLWKVNKCWGYHSELEVKPGVNRLSLELKRNNKAEREKAEAERRKLEAERKRRAQEKARAEAAAARKRAREKAIKDGRLSADGRYAKSSQGVITDNRTGLQWYVGPDRDTNWYDAKKWVEGLSVAGGGWRMPSRSELRSISQRGARNNDPKYLPPIFKIFGGWVWSGETRGSSFAWFFNFGNGGGNWNARSNVFNRAFAVRSRR